jgi:hypothetical protein
VRTFGIELVEEVVGLRILRQTASSRDLVAEWARKYQREREARWEAFKANR